MVISIIEMPPAQMASTARVASSTDAPHYGHNANLSDSANHVINGHIALAYKI